MSERAIVLAITGASGAAYAVRLLDVLAAAEVRVHLSISPAAALVLRQELGLEVDLERFRAEAILPFGRPTESALLSALLTDPAATAAQRDRQITYHAFGNLMAPIASGSFPTAGMVICPCSMSTLGAIVHGTGDNLIHRAAGVHLKERRKLVIVPRETPLSMIHLDNMRRAAEAGAVVLPAMPGMYHGPKSLVDLVDFVVARICDQLAINNSLIRRWGI